uniref:Yippee/Mis18/Cereblon domain-containing protein n=1 Tax=Bionectria ochroleuca TaxID=29856 RepID=A0A8H7TQX5_BIOOC
MDSVYCYCTSCDGRIGSVSNHWIKIGKNYLTPALESNVEFDVTTSQKIRVGEKDTLLDRCELQSTQCAICASTLGMKTVFAPSNHVLCPGQFIFRTSALVLKETPDAVGTIKPGIKRVLKLKEDVETSNALVPQPSAKDSYARPQPRSFSSIMMHDMNLVQLQVDVDAQRDDIQRINDTGVNVVSSFHGSMSQLERQVLKLTDSLQAMKEDWKRQQDELGAVKSELNQYKSKPSRKSGPVSDSETTSLRNDLSSMRRELTRVREENARLRDEAIETRDLARQGIFAAKECALEVAALRRQLGGQTDTPAKPPAARASKPAAPPRRPSAPKSKPIEIKRDEDLTDEDPLVETSSKPPISSEDTALLPRLHDTKQPKPGHKRTLMDLIDEDDEDEVDLVTTPKRAAHNTEPDLNPSAESSYFKGLWMSSSPVAGDPDLDTAVQDHTNSGLLNKKSKRGAS